LKSADLCVGVFSWQQNFSFFIRGILSAPAILPVRRTATQPNGLLKPLLPLEMAHAIGRRPLNLVANPLSGGIFWRKGQETALGLLNIFMDIKYITGD